MRLFEHPDFMTIMIATGEHFGMRPQLAEKDYYVTEALRGGCALREQGGFQRMTPSSHPDRRHLMAVEKP